MKVEINIIISLIVKWLTSANKETVISPKWFFSSAHVVAMFLYVSTIHENSRHINVSSFKVMLFLVLLFICTVIKKNIPLSPITLWLKCWEFGYILQIKVLINKQKDKLYGLYIYLITRENLSLIISLFLY